MLHSSRCCPWRVDSGKDNQDSCVCCRSGKNIFRLYRGFPRRTQRERHDEAAGYDKVLARGLVNAHDQHWHDQFRSSNARNQPTVEISEDPGMIIPCEEHSEALNRHEMQIVIVVYANAETKCGFGLSTSIGVTNSVRYLQSRLISLA